MLKSIRLEVCVCVCVCVCVRARVCVHVRMHTCMLALSTEAINFMATLKKREKKMVSQ